MSTDYAPPLDTSNFNIAVACIGTFLLAYGLVSYLLKEKFYLSEALIAVLVGVVLSPHATNWIRPEEYAFHNSENLETITLYFTRLVLDIQLVIAGVQLPKQYLRKEWRSMAIVLGPGMLTMWISTTLIVWAMVPHLPFIHALAVASCVTPTDPILANSIVKGKFADENIPKDLQNLIIAESGTNDGLGYPFLFIALYIIKYVDFGGAGTTGGASKAMGYWFGITWAYIVIIGALWGVVTGYVFRVALKWAEKRKYVDRESFIVFAVALALFIAGTGGLVGTDDVLASFIAGNVFTWDGWFVEETQDETFQATIDMLLNITIFAWYGVVAPWYQFAHNNVIPIYRLIFLGILIMLLRRMPFIAAAHKFIPQIRDKKRNFFMGFFGPIGVSAIFYLYTSHEFLRTIVVADHEREDAQRLTETITIVVWFMAITSIVVHGMAVPLAKFMFVLPRSLSRASTSAPFRITPDDPSNNDGGEEGATPSPDEPAGPIQRLKRAFTPAIRRGPNGARRADQQHEDRQRAQQQSGSLHGPVYKIGGSIIPDSDAARLPKGADAEDGNGTPTSSSSGGLARAEEHSQPQQQQPTQPRTPTIRIDEGIRR